MATQELERRLAPDPAPVRQASFRQPFARVLVPVDGSAHAEQSLPLALAIARAADGDIHLVWVRGADARRRVLTHAGSSSRMGHLEALTESVGDRLGAHACRAVLGGRAADAIVKHTVDADIDLIVMASRGHGSLWRLGIGSTTDAVIRMSPVPVLVMRAPGEAEPDLDRPPRLERMVVALDGSDAAESALGPALELARLFDARLTLLRVVETPVLPIERPAFGLDITREAIDVETRIAERYLERIAARLRAGGLAVGTAVREAPGAASGILRHVLETDADLVALATRGTGRAPCLLRGRTAARLLHDADVPLLVTSPGAPGFRG